MRMETDWVIHPKRLSRQLPRWWYPGFWWLLLAWVRISPVQSWLSIPAVRRRFSPIQVIFHRVQITLQLPRQCLPFCEELPQGNVETSSVCCTELQQESSWDVCAEKIQIAKEREEIPFPWSCFRFSVSAKWLTSGLVTFEIAGFAYLWEFTFVSTNPIGNVKWKVSELQKAVKIVLWY